jgi:hypothetical protein
LWVLRWPAGADAGIARVLRERVAALDHEVVDDAVEPGAVVELAVGELFEVGDGVGRLAVEQVGHDGALAGLDGRGLGHGACAPEKVRGLI